MVANKKLIEKLFKEYNKQYFNNKLPICSFGTHHSFKMLGYFSCYKDLYRPGKFKNMRITISYCYDFSEDELKHILLHEMIHLYLVHTKSALDGNLDHGYLFTNTMREFNKKFGLNIQYNYNHVIKRAPAVSRLLWWWHNKVMG